MRTTVVLDCPTCGQRCPATVIQDAGIWSFRNGDPGYPPSSEIEWYGGCACDWSDADVERMEAAAFQAAEEIQAANLPPQDDYTEQGE